MKKAVLKNQKGFAIVEAVAFLMAFLILTVYTIDTFTAIHSGILGSIGARNYLFETLQHRANIAWIRQQNADGAERDLNYTKEHQRFHTIIEENQPATRLIPTGRNLSAVSDDDKAPQRFGADRASTIQLHTGYGICLDAACPGGG